MTGEDKTVELPVASGSPSSAWDPWRALVATSPARIGLGRAGAAVRTAVHLEFQAAHAAARDAVHIPWDVDAARAELAPIDARVARSRARDRQEYLLRPDLGRALEDASRVELEAARAASDVAWDVALVVTNGLSTEGVRRHGAGLVTALLAGMEAIGCAVAPVVLVADGRVALGDPIGAALGARAVVVVVGERPGLSAADSVGIYLTLLPEAGVEGAVVAPRSDADRNCISNVHPPGGLDYAHAAAKCTWLLREALVRGYSGVQLKDESPSGLALVMPSSAEES